MTRARKDERGGAPEFRADEVIAEMLARDSRVEKVLAGFGLLCGDCVVKDTETLAEGCAPLGLSVETVLARLNGLRGS
jgi:hypothetical protein